MKVPTGKRNTYLKAAKGQSKPPKEETSIGVWRPLPGTKFQTDPELKPDEETQVKDLREYVDNELALPESDDYYKMEQRYLNQKNCMYRFLKASDWKMPEAKERVKKTLAWRREYKPDLIPPDEIREETEGGKIIASGFDMKGRTVMYLRPAKENTDPSPTQIRHLVFQLERAIDLLPEGVSKVLLVIDYAGASSKSNPSMKTAKTIIDILQNHYAERLGQAVVVNCPWYLRGIFSTVSPFLDPATREKLQMNPNMKKLVPAEQLDAEFGGDYHFKYDWQIYLPAICKFCGINDDGTRTTGRPLLEQSMSQASKILRKENGEKSTAGEAEDQQEEAEQQASDAESATVVGSSPEGEEAGKKSHNPIEMVKRTGSTLSNHSKSSKRQKAANKKQKQRRPFLACFSPNGLDDDDISRKADSTRGVNSGHVHSSSSQGAAQALKEQQALDLTQSSPAPPQNMKEATPAEKKEIAELASANGIVASEKEDVAASKAGEPHQTEEEARVLEQHQNSLAVDETAPSTSPAPATITESLTKAASDELSTLQQAASQLVSNVWPASQASTGTESAQPPTESTSSGYLPSMPSLPAIAMPSMPTLWGSSEPKDQAVTAK